MLKKHFARNEIVRLRKLKIYIRMHVCAVVEVVTDCSHFSIIYIYNNYVGLHLFS